MRFLILDSKELDVRKAQNSEFTISGLGFIFLSQILAIRPSQKRRGVLDLLITFGPSSLSLLERLRIALIVCSRLFCTHARASTAPSKRIVTST
jgi:hypothetical protein